MKTKIETPLAPAALGPYSQAVQVNGVVYVSGQLGMSASGVLADGAAAQTTQAMTNIANILAVAGLSCSDIAKTTIFCTDLADFQAINEAYAAFFADAIAPARACVQVSALPKGAKVEVECVAAK